MLENSSLPEVYRVFGGVLGLPNRRKSMSGGSWGVLGSRGVILEGVFGDIGAKIGATWPELEPSKQQVGPKMGHVSAKTPMFGSLWGASAEF